MKRLLTLALLALATQLHAGYSKTQDFRPATAEELAMKSAPSAPGASAAILDWVRVDDDKESISAEYVRIKVFSEEGKKYGDIEVAYFPNWPYRERVTDVQGRTIRPDGTVVPFDGKIYDKVVFKGGGLTLRAKTFSLPDVQPGSIIEYRFNRRWSINMLTNTHWAVQRDIPLLHAKLTLKPYDSGGEFGSFFTYQGLPAGKLPVKVRDVYELELDNMPALLREDYAPPEGELTARVNFYYTSSRIRPEEFWNIQPGEWNKEIEKFVSTAPPSAPHAAPAEQQREELRKIYAQVQGLRNLSFEEEKSEQELNREKIRDAKNAPDVVKKGYGYRDDLTRAFVSLARAAKFEADVVRVAPRDERFFSNKIPDADQMSTEIALVTVGGQPLYLDPGTPGAPFGHVSWEKTSTPGIRMSKKAGPSWITVPGGTPGQTVARRNADLRLNGDTLEGTVSVVWSGQEALTRRLRGLNDDEAARKKALEDEVKGWFPDGATATLKEVVGHKSFDDTMKATFDVALPNAVSRAGSRVVVPISIFAAKAKNPFAPTTRTHSIVFPYARGEEDEVKLTLPDGLAPSALPAPVTANAGSVTYRNETKLDGRQIVFTRSMVLDTLFVDAKYYGALRKFFSAMSTADTRPLVLEKAQ